MVTDRATQSETQVQMTAGGEFQDWEELLVHLARCPDVLSLAAKNILPEELASMPEPFRPMLMMMIVCSKSYRSWPDCCRPG